MIDIKFLHLRQCGSYLFIFAFFYCTNILNIGQENSVAWKDILDMSIFEYATAWLLLVQFRVLKSTFLKILVGAIEQQRPKKSCLTYHFSKNETWGMSQNIRQHKVNNSMSFGALGETNDLLSLADVLNCIISVHFCKMCKFPNSWL